MSPSNRELKEYQLKSVYPKHGYKTALTLCDAHKTTDKSICLVCRLQDEIDKLSGELK